MMTRKSGTRLRPAGATPRESSPCWGRWVTLGGAGGGGHPLAWEYMVRLRLDRIISMLEVYSRALRPALSIKLAAMATENRRMTPTMTVAILKGVQQLFHFCRCEKRVSQRQKNDN